MRQVRATLLLTGLLQPQRGPGAYFARWESQDLPRFTKLTMMSTRQGMLRSGYTMPLFTRYGLGQVYLYRPAPTMHVLLSGVPVHKKELFGRRSGQASGHSRFPAMPRGSREPRLRASKQGISFCLQRVIVRILYYAPSRFEVPLSLYYYV